MKLLKIATAILAISIVFLGCDPFNEKTSIIEGNSTERSIFENQAPVKLIIGLKENNNSIAAVVSRIEDVLNSTVPVSRNMVQNYIRLERVHNTEHLKASIPQTRQYSVLSDDQQLQLAYNALDSEIEKALYRDFKVEVPASQSELLINKLQAMAEVDYVQIDNLNVLYDNPNDPYFQDGSLWGLTKTNCPEAWDITKGQNVIVAVIDSGVDGSHPDLVNNLWKSSTGSWGYDFSDNDNDPSPDGDHGTHVAGTIAGVGNNGQGVIGVAPNVTIMALKIFPQAYSSVCADAIRYAVDNGAKVLNNSWGPKNRSESDPTIENAIKYAHSKGAVVVFAAGNSNDDAQYYYGGNSPYTICVAAVDSNFNRASFSNYGSVVDIAAPGVGIKSTVINGSYGNKSGTSMAAPHIAGLAALILSQNPGYSYDQVLNKIKSTATPVSATNIGAGVMNAYAAVSGGTGSDTQAPTRPENLQATDITSTSLKLSWNASSDNVGVTGYLVYKNGALIKTTTTTNCIVDGLSPDTQYELSVKAKDAAGNQSAIATVSAKTTGSGNTTSWQPYTYYAEGDKVSQNGETYSCRQAHTSLPGWEPIYVPALWLKQ